MGGKELAPLLLFLIWFFVSGSQTPLPLIHPADSIAGVAERGGRSKPERWGRDVFRFHLSFTHPAQ